MLLINVCLGYKKVLQSIENAEFITIMWYNKSAKKYAVSQ